MRLRSTVIITLLAWPLALAVAADKKVASPIVAKAAAMADRGQLEEAQKLVREHLDKNPDDTRARILLGQLLNYDGRSDEAFKVWQAGVATSDDKLALVRLIAELYSQQASEGPSVTYRRGTVTYSPVKDKAAESKYKKERGALAVQAWQQAAELAPKDPHILLSLAKVQVAVADHQAALIVWQSGAEKFKEDASFQMGWASSLRALNRQAEAATHFEAALAIKPNLAEAHRALAEHYLKADPARADLHRQRAALYEYLPPFSKAPFSDKAMQILSVLAIPDSDEAKEDKATRQKRREARREKIEELMRDQEPLSTEFLAAICYRHEDHGRTEDRVFETLGERPGTAELLYELLHDAQSTCTIRGASLALARQKDPKIFDWLVRALPGDTRSMFHFDAAGALQVLGDARAVPQLIRIMDPEMPYKEAPSDDDPMRQSLGRLQNRQRCALALGVFKSPESQQALTAGLNNPPLAPYCRAALYRQTNDAGHLAALAAALKDKQKRFELFEIRRYFESYPEGKTALAGLPPLTLPDEK